MKQSTDTVTTGDRGHTLRDYGAALMQADTLPDGAVDVDLWHKVVEHHRNHVQRNNWARSCSCENCRYFDPDIENDLDGLCYVNRKPYEVNVFRHACKDWAGDIPTPRFYPPITKNDHCYIDTETLEVASKEVVIAWVEAERALQDAKKAVERA